MHTHLILRSIDRFCVFMHNETKQQFLQEQNGNKKNEEMINAISVPSYEFMPNNRQRRFIKTHLPFSLLPPSVMNKQAKVIYVARNPKDVAVSYYHLLRLYRTSGYIGDFTKFWDYFERDLLPWTPYWSHIDEGWEHRFEPNVLFMFYEEMNKVNFERGRRRLSGGNYENNGEYFRCRICRVPYARWRISSKNRWTTHKSVTYATTSASRTSGTIRP